MIEKVVSEAHPGKGVDEEVSSAVVDSEGGKRNGGMGQEVSQEIGLSYSFRDEPRIQHRRLGALRDAEVTSTCEGSEATEGAGRGHARWFEPMKRPER